MEDVVERLKQGQTNHSGSKYHRVIRDLHDPEKSVTVDVYAVTEAFGVSSGPIHHAVKKLLCPGQRGQKSAIQDLREARDAITRAIELAEAASGPAASG
jgi:hypothetical protein